MFLKEFLLWHVTTIRNLKGSDSSGLALILTVWIAFFALAVPSHCLVLSEHGSMIHINIGLRCIIYNRQIVNIVPENCKPE